MSSEWLTVEVGGERFVTTRETLCSHGGMIRSDSCKPTSRSNDVRLCLAKMVETGPEEHAQGLEIQMTTLEKTHREMLALCHRWISTHIVFAGYFAAVLGETGSAMRDSCSTLCVDRDSAPFHHILSWLRTGRVVYSHA